MKPNRELRAALSESLRAGVTLIASVAGWHVALQRRPFAGEAQAGLERYEVLLYNGLLQRWKPMRWKRTPHAALRLAATWYAVPDELWMPDRGFVYTTPPRKR